MAGKHSAQHYSTIDVDEIWNSGALGWAIRLRTIIGSIVVKGIVAGIAFWQTHWYIGAIISVVAVAVAAILLMVRRQWIRFTNSSNGLHNFAHGTRDDVQRILWDANSQVDLIHRFNISTVHRVAEYYRKLFDSNGINCAVRLAGLNDQGVAEFVTQARSEGMDPARKQKTNQMPIPADRGLAQALRSKDAQGVFIIRDIAEATEMGIWLKSPTDGFPDVKTLMAAPIIANEPKGRVMLGILYVTSKQDDFRAMHTIPLKMFADHLGLVYPLIFGAMPSGGVQCD